MGSFKILEMRQIQVGSLLGRGGFTIRDICMRSGAQITVTSQKHDKLGAVSITGNIERAEAIIREVLAQKGCPLPPPGDDPGAPAEGTFDDDELNVPADMVGLFLGKG